jgi:hypothetical protein
MRSSATAEDLPNASFAGQQESFLNCARCSIPARRGEEMLREPLHTARHPSPSFELLRKAARQKCAIQILPVVMDADKRGTRMEQLHGAVEHIKTSRAVCAAPLVLLIVAHSSVEGDADDREADAG